VSLTTSPIDKLNLPPYRRAAFSAISGRTTDTL
jgi:hypothetical protein